MEKFTRMLSCQLNLAIKAQMSTHTAPPNEGQLFPSTELENS